MNKLFPIQIVNASGEKQVYIIDDSWSLSEIQAALGDALPQAFIDSYNLHNLSQTDFKTLPNWATWTAQEAETYVNSDIFAGQTQAQVDAQIDALPNTIAGMKTGLKQAAAAIISIRTILQAIAKAIIYIRNIILK